MAETSRFWDGVTVGDAVVSPYDSETEFADVLRALFKSTSPTNQGAVISAVGGMLVPSGVVSPIMIQDGYAFVWGNWYHNDAALTIAIPTPASANRYDRIVLRKDWTAQTVRLVRIAGVEGGGSPAMVQNVGTFWDIPICTAIITTLAAITTLDNRELSVPIGASLFVPWTGGGPFPTTGVSFAGAGIGVSQNVALTGVPSNAVAVAVTFSLTTGVFDTLDVSSPAAGVTSVYQGLFSIGDANDLFVGPMTVPIAPANPRQIQLKNQAAATFDVLVSGWWVPFFG